MYYILMKRQIIRLSNDISNIKMGKRMLLKSNLLFSVKYVKMPAKVPKIEPFYYISLKPQ